MNVSRPGPPVIVAAGAVIAAPSRFAVAPAALPEPIAIATGPPAWKLAPGEVTLPAAVSVTAPPAWNTAVGELTLPPAVNAMFPPAWNTAAETVRFPDPVNAMFPPAATLTPGLTLIVCDVTVTDPGTFTDPVNATVSVPAPVAIARLPTPSAGLAPVTMTVSLPPAVPVSTARVVVFRTVNSGIGATVPFAPEITTALPAGVQTAFPSATVRVSFGLVGTIWAVAKFARSIAWVFVTTTAPFPATVTCPLPGVVALGVYTAVSEFAPVPVIETALVGPVPPLKAIPAAATGVPRTVGSTNRHSVPWNPSNVNWARFGIVKFPVAFT